MKEIKLTHGKVAIIDDDDFEMVSGHRWHVSFKDNNAFYAATNVYPTSGHTIIQMHILIIGKKPGFEIDHINHNGLDNRRVNLRHVTSQQNNFNRAKRKNCSSAFKGVHWNKCFKKWQASIVLGGSKNYLGGFLNEVDAAKAYNSAAIKNYGEFACLNKI